MKPREYEVLDMAIENGVGAGWRAAHKHVEDPSADQIRDAIETAVSDSICEWFEFDDEGEE